MYNENFLLQKCVFKASWSLLFSLSIINQYCTSNVRIQKCVFKASGNLLFSLLSYFVHESIRNFCFLIIIRNYFVWKNLFFSDERDVELYLTLVFRKFAKQAKSALITCNENFFILRLISSHPGVWNFFYFTLKFNFNCFIF